MAKRAFPLEARAAFEIQAEDVGLVGKRRREAGRRRAVERDDRALQRGGDVHQAGVVADDEVGHGQQVDGLGQRGGAAQVAAEARGEAGDFLGDGVVLGRAEQPDGVAVIGQAARQPGEVGGRPALGRAVFGARAEGDKAGRAFDGQFGQGLLLLRCGRPDFWPKNGFFQRFPGMLGQLGEALDHQRQRLLVQAMPDVDQAVARLAGEPDAPRDAGQKGNQGRFQRVGQDIDGVVTPCRQLAGQPPACLERHLAVPERAVDDVRNLGHAVQHRGHPARRHGIELQTGMPGVQPGKERLRHDGVADPGRGDDQSFH